METSSAFNRKKLAVIFHNCFLFLFLSLFFSSSLLAYKSAFKQVQNSDDDDYTQEFTPAPKKKKKVKKYYKNKSKKTWKKKKKKSWKKKSLQKKSWKKKSKTVSKKSKSTSIQSGDYNGENIPGINSTSNNKLTLKKNGLLTPQDLQSLEIDKSLNSISQDSSSLTKKGQQSEMSQSGLPKNISANGSGPSTPLKSDVDMESESFKYSRHILISLLVLVFLVFRLKGTRRSAFDSDRRR